MINFRFRCNSVSGNDNPSTRTRDGPRAARIRVKRNDNHALVGTDRPPPATCSRYSRIDICVSADHHQEDANVDRKIKGICRLRAARSRPNVAPTLLLQFHQMDNAGGND
jgi:hypothetical protein